MSVNHWKKLDAKKTRDKIKKLIAAKPTRFKELLIELDCSPTTLTGHLKALKKDGIIRLVIDPENNKNLLYEIAPESKERVNAEIDLYEAVQFIENLNNPIYSIKKKGTTTVSLFTEWKDVKDRAKAQKQIDTIISGLTAIFKVSRPLGDKFAIVVTKTKEGTT